MIGCKFSLDLLTKVQIVYIKILTSPANCNFDGPSSSPIDVSTKQLWIETFHSIHTFRFSSTRYYPYLDIFFIFFLFLVLEKKKKNL